MAAVVEGEGRVQRHRSIAAAPIRTAAEAWQALVTLLAETLERSSQVEAGTVAQAMDPLRGIGPAMAAAGHLDRKPLVLVDEALYVNFTIRTGDAALAVEENLSAVPGGASATQDWKVFLPTDTPMSSAAADAVKGNAHLSVAAAPPYEESETTASLGGPIDLVALDELGGRR